MPLLLIPLALLAIVMAWLLLMPLALWQRYRRGHARRRAVPWAIAVNAWLLLASVVLFVLTAWLNVASGAVDFHAPLPARMVVAGRSTVADALREVERTLLDPASTQAEMKAAMQLAQAIGS